MVARDWRVADLRVQRQRTAEQPPALDDRAADAVAEIHQQKILALRFRVKMPECRRTILLHQ